MVDKISDLQFYINKYLDWNIKKTDKLIEKKINIIKNNYLIAIFDLPYFSSYVDYEVFINIIKEAGYNNINLGLTNVWEDKISIQTINQIKKNIPIISAHGTSFKKKIIGGMDYKYYLKKDLSVLDVMDSEKKMIINYDLFAGHSKNINFSDDFFVTQNKNFVFLADKLDIKEKNNLELLIIEKIISEIDEIYANSGRTICLEIPGSKGWSMMPEVSEKNIEFIIKLIRDKRTKMKLCVDIGHLLTWIKDEKDLKIVLNLLKENINDIGMIHISSAGSDNDLFEDIYRMAYGFKYPNWHIRSLDLSLPVFEERMIVILDFIRRVKNDSYLEVSETRRPSVAIEDYFKNLNFLIDDGCYYNEIIKQGRILNYI